MLCVGILSRLVHRGILVQRPDKTGICLTNFAARRSHGTDVHHA